MPVAVIIKKGDIDRAWNMSLSILPGSSHIDNGEAG